MKQLCVQLKQVNFAYPGHELILKNINLEIWKENLPLFSDLMVPPKPLC